MNMKKLFFILSVLTATAWTIPQLAQIFPSAISTVSNFAKNALILKFNDDRSPTGSYHYNFQTSDGIKKEEIGEVRNPGAEDESLAVAGQYSYIGDDGRTYSVKYRADERGFHPLGDHLVQSLGEKERTNKLGLPKDAVASLINS